MTKRQVVQMLIEVYKGLVLKKNNASARNQEIGATAMTARAIAEVLDIEGVRALSEIYEILGDYDSVDSVMTVLESSGILKPEHSE